jgi:hypothetical protein
VNSQRCSFHQYKAGVTQQKHQPETVGVAALSMPKILETDQPESRLQSGVCVYRLIEGFIQQL